MDNATERGMALCEDATEVRYLWRKVSRLADAIKVCLDRHSELRRTDPEYREALDYLNKLLLARPGQVGQMIRMVSAGNTRLVKVL